MRTLAVVAFFMIFLSHHTSYAQFNICGEELKEDRTGSITAIQDAKLDSALQKYADFNKENFELTGYRVQIFFDSKREEVLKTRNQFSDAYPETPIYLVYEQPFFKLRIGDFRNKIDAQRLMAVVIKDYSSAFVVKTKIDFPEFD